MKRDRKLYFYSARGIYYLTTNARKPYAQGFPGKRRPAEGDSRTAKNKKAKPKRLRKSNGNWKESTTWKWLDMWKKNV